MDFFLLFSVAGLRGRYFASSASNQYKLGIQCIKFLGRYIPAVTKCTPYLLMETNICEKNQLVQDLFSFPWENALWFFAHRQQFTLKRGDSTEKQNFRVIAFISHCF